MSDHRHYEYAEQHHDHRGDYADQRHDHDIDYAVLHHRHHDLERDIEALQRELRDYRQALDEYERDLSDARRRVAGLEQQTPQARQLQLEADLAAADLAESGYDRHGRDCQCSYCATGESGLGDFDPGPEVDDEGGISEYRYILPEDYERGQS